jgi:hypothetical protein
MAKNKEFISVLCIFLISSCGFLGKKTDTSFIEIPDYSVRAVSYVPIQPVITGFDNPSDICIGYDRLIYVVDKGTEEIICYDESMVELGRKKIQGASVMTQDRKLDLLVLGTSDTLINQVAYTFTCIYRLQLKNSVY